MRPSGQTVITPSFDTVDLNIKYRSRGPIKYLKYGKYSNAVIVEESLVTGGRLLDDGRKGGFARIEGEAEGGFFQYKFICNVFNP